MSPSVRPFFAMHVLLLLYMHASFFLAPPMYLEYYMFRLIASSGSVWKTMNKNHHHHHHFMVITILIYMVLSCWVKS